MITTKYLTKNRTYTTPTKIVPQYVIVHSTASAVATTSRLWSSWNSSSVSLSCHGMVDASGSLLTLPLDVKGHHVGSRGNGISVGFEICEPANIVYKDKYHTEIDTEKYDPNNSANHADFLKRYNNAVELAAFMCRQTGVKPENVICHKEAARKGIATGHADVLHWFPLFGKSMDDFRKDVAFALKVFDIKNRTKRQAVSSVRPKSFTS